MTQPDEAVLEDATADEQALIDLINAMGFTVASPVVRDGGWYVTIIKGDSEYTGVGSDRFIALGDAADKAGLGR